MQGVKTERKWVNKVWTVECAECGRNFSAKRSDASFCGSTCRSRWSRRPKQMQDDINRVIAMSDQIERLLKQYGRDNVQLMQAIARVRTTADRIVG